MNIDKSISIEINSKQDIRILRGLVRLGISALLDVDKEAWGEKLQEYETWGRLFLEQTTLNNNSDSGF
jgi:hypothetical protein